MSCLIKKLFLETLQYSKVKHKNTCIGVLFLIQNIAKFLRAPILKNIGEWLLLKICS